MQIFRGYIPTENKSCIRRFKNRDVLPYEKIKNRSEFAGVLSDDAILIDIDDGDQAEMLARIVEDKQLNCRITQTTRGKHFFFSNKDKQGRVLVDSIGNAKRLACGLTADVKSGIKNGYAIVKFNGEERFVEWEPETAGKYDPLPCWLRMVPANIDFLNLEAGEGRNNSLFSYILTLQSNGFTVDECRETIHVINDYILSDPLDADEIEKILRDESFEKELFFVKGKFLFDVFAEFIKNRHRIILINGQLHVYHEGIYTPNQKAIESLMIRYIKNLKETQRNEVLKYLRLICPEAKETADAKYIAFQNGVFDLETGQLLEFSPEIVLTNKLACNYNAEAYNETMDKTLNKLSCNDPQIRALLEECVGYCFYRRNELGKAFMLTGDKSNGKSTFLEVINTLLGSENVSNLDINELGERFSTIALFGRLANIGDDISDEFMKGAAVAMFKEITTGSRIKAEQKGQPVFEFSPYVKLLFSANDIPRMRDKTGAVLRRLVIIPFNATFSKSDPDFDPFIVYKLKEQSALEYLASLGLKGLKRVIDSRGFTESDKVKSELKEYERENDPALAFFESTEADEIENESTADVYRRYTVFCSENNFNPLAATAFIKKTTAHYGFKTTQKSIKGKRVRIFVER